MYKVKCAWCGKIIRTDYRVEGSHGICEKCKKKLFKEVEKKGDLTREVSR